jgi:hypothetical protein
MTFFKKIIAVILLIAVNTTVVFAGNQKFKSPVNQTITSYDRAHIENEVVYNVIINGERINKTVKVNEYSAKSFDCMSMRDFVESVGGSFEWHKENISDEWDVELGGFKIFNTEFKIKGRGISNLPHNEGYPINIYQYIDGKEVCLNLGIYTESANAKLINNELYISLKDIRGILPRLGYIYNLDKDSKTLNIKSYDFETEKSFMLKKFPSRKFESNKYSDINKPKDYEELSLTGDLYCYDLFEDEALLTRFVEINYNKLIDNEFKPIYSVGENQEQYYKNLFQAAYSTYMDDINVDYDTDLDAYIIYNHDYKNSNWINNSYKILVVRKFDNMILFQI